MLDLIRRFVKSWMAKALLGLLVLSFAVWGIGDVFSFSMNTPVAEVGDREVTAEAYSEALQRRQNALSRQAGRAIGFTDMRRFGLDRQVLAGLVRDAALAAELDAMGLAAPDGAVAEAIRESEAFRGADGAFSPTVYRNAVESQGFTRGEYEALRRELLGQEMLVGSIAGPGTAPPGMAARIAAHEGEERAADTVRLTLAMAEAPEAPATAALEAHVAANADLFREPERKYGRYLHIDLAALAETIEIDEDTLRAEYEARIDAFTRPAEAEIDQINFADMAAAEAARARMDAEDLPLEAIAVERGESPEDLDVGTVGPDDLPASVAEAVFSAEAPGIVGPVETPFGAALIRVRRVQRAETASFEAVRDTLADQIAERRAFGRAPEIENEVQDLRAAGATLEEIAEVVEGTRVGAIEGWAADDTVATGELPAVLAVEDASAELSAALDGEERELVALPTGGSLIVAIDRIEPAHVPPLDEIRERVTADWVRTQKLASLRARAKTLVERAAGSATLAEALDETDPAPAVEPVGPFRRDAGPSGLPNDLAARLFALEIGEAAFAEGAGGETVVVAELTRIVPLAPEAAAERAEEIRRALGASIAQDQAGRFVRSVEALYGARVNEAAIDAVFERLGAYERAPGS